MSDQNSLISADPDAVPARAITIDEEGYFSIDGIRVSDQESGASWLASIRMNSRGLPIIKMPAAAIGVSVGVDRAREQDVLVEAFDFPLVALDVEPSQNELWDARFPYEMRKQVDSNSLCVDEWDRFMVRTVDGVPAVLSRSAQSRLFQAADDFDDDSVTFSGRKILIRPIYVPLEDARKSSWWNTLYEKSEHQERWDQGIAHPALDHFVPPLKMTRSRVLVLGCGSGHDANWWSQRGHIVTGMDFSAAAIDEARTRYGESSDLKWIQADAFSLGPEWNGRFDVIFENKFYCAVDPSLRGALVKTWRRLLTRRGRVVGIVPLMDKCFGPPFGGTEWELRQRMIVPARKEKHGLFLPLIWTRIGGGGGVAFDTSYKPLGQELFFVVERGVESFN